MPLKMITNTGVGAAAAPYPGADIAAAVARALAAARDRPNPVDDVHRTAKKYARLGRDFRRGAWRHLEEGDLPPGMIMFAPACASANCFRSGFTSCSVQMVWATMAASLRPIVPPGQASQ